MGEATSLLEDGLVVEIVIREATLEDRMALWSWYHDPLRDSFNKKTRPASTFAQHRAWFANVSKGPGSIICVGLLDILRIGAVRFDRLTDDGEFEARLCLKPAYCGQTYAPKLLKAAATYLRREKSPVTKVSLSIQKINPASRAVFLREGFVISADSASGFRVDT